MESVSSEQKSYETQFLCLSLLFLISLLYSYFLLSISFLTFILLALVDIRLRPLSVRWRPQLKRRLESWINDPAWWVVTLSFLMVLFGGLYSDDTSYWITRLRIKTPFLLAPVAFYLLPKISRSTYQWVHVFLVLVLTLSTLPILYQYLTDFRGIMEGLKMGKAVETPIRHIRYSLLLSLACISSFILWKEKLRISPRLGPHVFLYPGIFLFIFVHLLAVRSGIATLYLTGFIFIIQGLYHGHNRRAMILALAILISAPVVAYLVFPSFAQRISYMSRDVSQYQKEEWNAYSDAERILSVRAGLALGKEAPLIGVGPGDLRNEMSKYFYAKFDKDTFLLPHNQYVSTFAGSGILGLVLFLIAIFLPLMIHQHFRNPYFLAMNCIVLLSLLVENTFETSVGVAIYIFFLMLGLNHLKPDDIQNDATTDPVIN